MQAGDIQRPFPFTIKTCLSLILLYTLIIPVLFFSPLLIAKLFGFSLAQKLGITSSNFIAIVILAQVVAAFVLYWLIAQKLRLKQLSWSSLGLRKFNGWRAFKFIAGWPLVLIATTLIIVAITSLFDLSPPDNSKDAVGSLLSGNLLLGLVFASLFAPLIEEILFRGMLFSALTAKYGYAYGVALSSLVFAVIHLNPLQILTAIILGPYLCWMYKKLNSIYPGMILHALHNAAVTVLFFSR